MSTLRPAWPVDEGLAGAALELGASTSLIEGAWARAGRCDDDDWAICGSCGLGETAEMLMARFQASLGPTVAPGWLMNAYRNDAEG